jgi:cardiolipin synthase
MRLESLLNMAHLLVLLAGVVASVFGAAHALLTKRDPRSAAAWVSVCLLFPVLGAIAYFAIGNNRIRTRARRLHAGSASVPSSSSAVPEPLDAESHIAAEYRNLAYLGRAASGNALLTGNSVEALHNGDQAYPAMLAAIRGARRYVHLATYIFDAHGRGRDFVRALAEAKARGVEVRVLLDGFGELYSLPRVGGALRRAGIEVQRFLPPRLLPPNFSLNLRNHRKILVVDGREAFTGGMNLRTKHCSRPDNKPPRVVDVHFRLRGPVVAQIDRVFRADWRFSCGQTLGAAPGAEELGGDAPECRVIVDGPDEDLDKLLWVLVGAISLARTSIRIMTPYFLPPRELAVALQTAALRGVEVTIALPAHNNFRFMTWAATHGIGYLLKTGVKVYFLDGPFVHSKLFLVDDYYAQIGSSNIDPRSLRLNFELAVEVYDHAFGAQLAAHFRASLDTAAEYRYPQWRRRSLPRRLRDAFFWLFSPYL